MVLVGGSAVTTKRLVESEWLLLAFVHIRCVYVLTAPFVKVSSHFGQGVQWRERERGRLSR